MAVLNYDRDDLQFICKATGATPISDVDQLRPEKLGKAQLIEEFKLDSERRVLKLTGGPANSKSKTIFCRGSN